MTETKTELDIEKESIIDKLYLEKKSSLKKYQNFFVGSSGFSRLLKFELITMFLGPLPGAFGYLARKFFFPKLFKSVGSNVNWGRNITLRHPGNIIIGQRVAVDDNCMLDAKGAGSEGINIGDDVLIARDTIIQAKYAPVSIGNRCIIGSQCQISSAGGIQVGDCVMLAGQCYIGGGRYHTEDKNTPMMDQGLFSKGQVIIDRDVWIGAGAVVLDGVRIGKGSFIGAGAVISEDILENTIVAPFQKLIKLPRG